MITPAQPPVFAQTPGPAPSLAAEFAGPTTIGNSIVVHVRFSPTGVPVLADSYGNAYQRIGTLIEGGNTAVGFWTANVLHGGANHTLTVTAMGGSQTIELGMTEFSMYVPQPGPQSPLSDIQLAALQQLYEQTALLQRLATAERA